MKGRIRSDFLEKGVIPNHIANTLPYSLNGPPIRIYIYIYIHVCVSVCVCVYSNVLVCSTYITWWKVPTVVSGIVVFGALVHCALCHSLCDLKATQVKVLHSLMGELIMYDFELGLESTKNLCCTKGKGRVDYVWLKKNSLSLLPIRQFQVGLKPWIARPCSKP